MSTAEHRDRHGWDPRAARALFAQATAAGLTGLTAVPFAGRVLVTATGWPIRPFFVRTPTHIGAGLLCVAFLLTRTQVTGRRACIHLTIKRPHP